MSSIATLRWASTLAALLPAVLAGGVTAASPEPAQTQPRPVVTLLPNSASVQSKSYVS